MNTNENVIPHVSHNASQMIIIIIVFNWETYSTQRGRESRHQAYKSIFGLMWPWSLTSWPPKLKVSCPGPADHLCQFASKSDHWFSKYYRHKSGSRRTNGETDRRTDGRTNERTSWEHNASACQSDVAKV